MPETMVIKKFKIQKINMDFDKILLGNNEVETDISFIADVDKSKTYFQLKMTTLINNVATNERILEMISIGEFD